MCSTTAHMSQGPKGPQAHARTHARPPAHTVDWRRPTELLLHRGECDATTTIPRLPFPALPAPAPNTRRWPHLTSELEVPVQPAQLVGPLHALHRREQLRGAVSRRREDELEALVVVLGQDVQRLGLACGNVEAWAAVKA